MATGARYLSMAAFMPVHAAIAGRSWGQIDPGTQALIPRDGRRGSAIVWIVNDLRRLRAWTSAVVTRAARWCHC